MSTEKIELKSLAARKSIRDTVTSALRSAIVAGEMVPGEVYSAPTLAATFGVSATPIRESMLDLAKEGLVEPVRNKGFRITTVTSRDLDEIAQVRLLVEPPSVRDVTDTIPESAFDELRQFAEQTVTAAREGDLVTYLDADRSFHLRLMSFTGNSRLKELISDLRNHTRLFGLKELADAGVLVNSAQEHHELLDAIEARDAKLAEKIMREHIAHIRLEWS